MSARRSILHCFRYAIIAVSVMAAGVIFHSEAFAQVPANLDLSKMSPDEMRSIIPQIPIEQIAGHVGKLKPNEREQLKGFLASPEGKSFLERLPEAHANALRKAVEQTNSSQVKLPPLPNGKIQKLYLHFQNSNFIFFEAVSSAQEKAKQAEIASLVKQGESPYFQEESKYILKTMEFVPIPAGSFFMGSNVSEKGRLVDELRHEVQITKPFWMACFEVTQEQWEAVMRTPVMNTVPFPDPNGKLAEGTKLFSGVKGPGYPVFNVTHEEAMDFCQELTKLYRKAAQRQKPKEYYRLPENMEFTLPTEAQWEYACRAGTLTPFSSGDDLLGRDAIYHLVKIKVRETRKASDNNRNNEEDRGNNNSQIKVEFIEKDYTPKIFAVGCRNKNAWGLYDMHGSVWEWCKGCYYPYTQGKAIDPPGLRSGAPNVARGGSWYSLARDCRSARRLDIDGKTRQNNIGFRVVIVEK